MGGGCGEPSIPASCSPQNCFYLTSVVAIFTTWLFSGFNCDLHVRLRWELEPGVCLSLKGGSLHPWRCLESLDVALGTTLMLGLRLGWTISEVFSILTDLWLCGGCAVWTGCLHALLLAACQLCHLEFISTSVGLLGPSRSEENLWPRVLSSFIRALTS